MCARAMQKIKSIAVVFLIGISLVGMMMSTVQATLVSQDLTGVGTTVFDGITFDADTNLEWLDLPVTVFQTTNDILFGFTPTGWSQTTIDAGFRFATINEVAIFFSSGLDGVTGVSDPFFT